MGLSLILNRRLKPDSDPRLHILTRKAETLFGVTWQKYENCCALVVRPRSPKMLRTIVLVLSCLAACAQSASRPLTSPSKGPPGFTLSSPESTGIRFTNRLTEEHAAANRVLETGSGVAAGDIDRDGRVDLFF